MSIIFPGQPASYYSFGNGILGLNGFSIQAQPPVPATTAYELTLENDGHGTVSASTLSGFPGDSATLSTTPSTDYEFSGYDVTGGTIEGNTFIYGNTDATARACFKQSIVNLTLQTDGHGTLTATSITGRPGDTVTLTPTYNTYYRFSGYQTTGGTINGNTYTFGTATNQTAKANFKTNNFTACGVFNEWKLTNSPWYYSGAVWYAHFTGGTNVPTAWYNKTYTSQYNASQKKSRTSGWCPTNPSNYSITANVTGAGFGRNSYVRNITAKLQVNGSDIAQATTSVSRNSTLTNGPAFINKTSTSTGYLRYLYVDNNSLGDWGSNATRGTFTATGYAP